MKADVKSIFLLSRHWGVKLYSDSAAGNPLRRMAAYLGFPELSVVK
jgi:hypothetical protein